MINLNNAITVTGEEYEDIGKMFDDQPKNDWERLGDTMHDYRGLLAGWPNVLQIHQVRGHKFKSIFDKEISRINHLSKSRSKKIFFSPLSSFQGAIGKRKEFERMLSDGKLGQSEATEIANRTDTLSYAMLGEISTFHAAKAKDMKLVHQAFLQEQIKFYQQVN